MIDYHTHTYLCKHASGKPEEYLAEAEKAGLTEYGISDHCPWPDGYDPECRMFVTEYPQYEEIVERITKKATKVQVKYGIEIDWVPGRMNEIYNNINKYEFDYIIGSVHYTDDFAFDNPDLLPVWEEPGKPEWVWTRYYEHMLDFVSDGKFNIIGHFDLPKKFGSIPPDTQAIDNRIEDILTAAADNGIAIEINTGGLRKPAKEMYPSMKILKKAAKKGIMLTFGSDAHGPKQIAANFAEALQVAKEAGFTKYHSFSSRKPIPITL